MNGNIKPINDPQPPLPADLAKTLPKPRTPWMISQRLFQAISEQTNAPKNKPQPYIAVPVDSRDPEYDFVLKYFFHQKPPGLCIKSIMCVHNAAQTKMFEGCLQSMEEAAAKFLPKWQEEDCKEERAATMKRWETCVQQFSPVQIETPKRVEVFVKSKVLPLWHGSSKAEAICASGFTIFGKHHLMKAGAKEGANKVVDLGFFGSGIYFTNSAQYAAMYSPETLMLCWVSMRPPYPVVSDVAVPRKGKDMLKLEGLGNYQDYNAHYIPVTSYDPSDPECMNYHPCSKAEAPAWDEHVVFQPAQTLPRIIVKLGVDFPAAPSQLAVVPPQPAESITAEMLLNKMLELLESEAVRKDASVQEILAAKSDELITANPKAVLSQQDTEFYSWMLKVIDPATGQIRSFVKTRLTQRLANKPSNGAGPTTPQPEKKKDERDAKPSALTPMPEPFERVNSEMDVKQRVAGRNALHQAVITENTKAFVLEASKDEKAFLDLFEGKDANGDTPLALAVELGRYEDCTILLDAGKKAHVNLYSWDNEGNNALHKAVRSGNYNTVKLFSSDGQLLNEGNHTWHTPLMLAAQRGRKQICELLLASQAEIDLVNQHGMTALFLASINGHTSVCALLLQSGATLIATDSQGQTILHKMAKPGETEMAQWIIGQNVLLNIPDSQGNTPLMLAAEQENRALCEMLVKAGADLKAQNKKQWTALHQAIAMNRPTIVELLVADKSLLVQELTWDHGNTETEQDKGSPLLFAARSGNRKICSLLLNAGADPNAKTTVQGRNALQCAAASGKVEVLRQFFTKRYQLDVPDTQGRTPLLLAAAAGSQEACEFLMREGASLQVRDHQGRTVLHLAAASGKADVVQLFVSQHDLVISKTKEGMVPLDYAALSGSLPTCKLLMEAGAKSDGATYWAATSGNPDVLRLVLQEPHVPNRTDAAGNSPLHLAALAGSRESCELLLKAKEDPKATNKNGQDAFSTAVLSGKPDVVQLFIADKEILRHKKNSASILRSAAMAGAREVCDLLLQEGVDPKVTDPSWEENALHAAVRSGNLEALQPFLSDKELLDGKDSSLYGYTPLLLAVTLANREMCERLMKAGADWKVCASGSNNALHLAVKSGRAELVQLFLSKKPLLNAPDRNGMTPVMLAAQAGWVEGCKLLCFAGADLTIKTGSSYSSKNVLCIAVESHTKEVLQFLLAQKGVKDILNDLKGSSYSPLMLAAQSGWAEGCALLIQAGSDISLKGSYPYSAENALHIAVRSGHKEVVQLFLSQKDLLNVKNQAGETPLQLAAQYNKWEVCALIAAAGADPAPNSQGFTVLDRAISSGIKPLESLISIASLREAVNKEGLTPLVYAFRASKWDWVVALINAGANAIEASSNGGTLLHWAIRNKQAQAIEALLACPSLLNAKDQAGNTPLQIAAQCDNAAVCEQLLKLKADPTIPNEAGNTVLHNAAASGSAKVLELFLTQKDMINARNKKFQNPLYCAVIVAAKSDSIRSMCEQLVKAGGQLIDKVSGQTILHLAVTSEEPNRVSYLLAIPQVKELIDRPDPQGHTPLTLAASKGTKEACFTLLSNGANLKAKGASNKTAADWASSNKHKDLAQSLKLWKPNMDYWHFMEPNTHPLAR